MIKRLALTIVFLTLPLSVFGQFYTASQIQTVIDNKSGLEGDLYMDTINNMYYIGITNGRLVPFNSDSTHIADLVLKQIIDDSTLSDESETKAPSQKSVKTYVDSVANNRVSIENELFFDGSDHANSTYHNFYYVSMKADAGYIVVRYNKQDVNDEARAEADNTAQPIVLNDIVGLTFN